jgi:glycosyltransferase involved in cell wall biosynthesis
LRKSARVPVEIIPNGVDTRAISHAKPSDFATDVLFVGRLIREKRADLLLAAAPRVAAQRGSLHVTIVGQGPQEDELRKQAALLPASVQVDFLPAIATEAELYGRMKSAKMLVLPSEREGYGLVVAEAQASGTVPIVGRAPDSAAVELVDHGQTGLVTNLNATELAAAMIGLLSDAELRRSMGEAAIRVSASRDWDSTAEATAALFRRTCGGPATEHTCGGG